MSGVSGQGVLREDSPSFFAWCADGERVDAFAAALSALTRPHGWCSITSPEWLDYMPVEEAAARLRAVFNTDTYSSASYSVTLSSNRTLDFGAHCCGDGPVRRGAVGPIGVSPFDKVQLLPLDLPMVSQHGARSVEVEAAVSALVAQDDVEDILLRLCAPDATRRVTTGGCTRLWHWGAPIEIGATYHADAATVARDLALSWVHLHDKERMDHATGMSLEALHARVDAAPIGSSIAVDGGGRLSREVVLAALKTSPAALLDALEASVLPDDEWRAVEPLALAAVEAMTTDASTYRADVSTRKHFQFLRHHAPYHVRRLPNGGVILATHPYRTLWQLYVDALFLLGITPS